LAFEGAVNKSKLRREIFAREYVIDLNATRAAIAAGYSAKTAESSGSRLLSNVKVSRLIDALHTKRASKLEITAEKLDEECAKLAFANMGDYISFDEDGKPRGIDLSKISKDQWAAVHEIREDATGGGGDGERRLILRTTLKLSDKTKNLELLYRRLGLLQDNLKVSGLDGLADKLAHIRRRKIAS
jgi:phage terminase small subunit